MHWILMPYRRALDFSGRSRRREYWLFALCVFVFFIVLSSVFPVFIADAVAPFLLLGIIIPGLAVAVRRLHDLGRSGWWITAPIAPIVFWAVALVGGFSSDALFRLVMPTIMLAWLAVLILLAIEGTRGPNKYGDDPKSEPAPSTPFVANQ